MGWREIDVGLDARGKDVLQRAAEAGKLRQSLLQVGQDDRRAIGKQLVDPHRIDEAGFIGKVLRGELRIGLRTTCTSGTLRPMVVTTRSMSSTETSWLVIVRVVAVDDHVLFLKAFVEKGLACERRYRPVEIQRCVFHRSPRSSFCFSGV
jgi:hypothetical protein